VISIRDLHLTYRSPRAEFHALNGVDLDLARGQFLTLLGPSGCGKTTLLRCLAGLELPDSGQIRLGEQTVFDGDTGVVVPAAQRDLGMVFQSYAIWPHMSVFENIAFPLQYRRRNMDRNKLRSRVMECLELVRLGGLAERPAPLLSGGQQQRLALARALAAEPALLLLDEPLSNLDARLREDMRFELREITRRSCVTTIFVTHEQSEALSMSDVIAVMNGGRIIQRGTPTDLYREPRSVFVATFLSRSNLLTAEVVGRAVDGTATVASALGRFDCALDGAASIGERVTMVVRPESIRLAVIGPERRMAEYATVRGVAFLGECVECALQLGDLSLIARVPSNLAPVLGAKVAITVDQNEIRALTSSSK
jgi:iron(III) transport system ATP-binding protein